MDFVSGFVIGILIGFIGGLVVGRNNKKKVEAVLSQMDKIIEKK